MSTVLVEIAVPEGIAADEFDAHVRPLGGTEDQWTHAASSRAPRFEIDLPSTGSYEVGVGWRVNGALVDPDLWTVVPITAEQTRDFSVPDDVESFGVGQEGGTLRFTWREVVVEHLSHYELRRLPASVQWDDGLWIADIPAPVSSFVVGWMASGAQTYALKAVTAQGIKSATHASAAITVRADDYYVQQTSTAEATAFTGTKTGSEVVSNTLRPTTHPASYADKSLAYTAYTDPWWYPTARRPTYVTAWIDAGAVMDEKVEVDLAYATADLCTSYAQYHYPHDAEIDDVTAEAIGPGDVRPGHLRTAAGKSVQGVRIRVEIDTAQDAGPTPEGFRDWVPGTVYRFRQYRLRVTWLNDWPWIRPAISTLTHKIKRRNLKDEQSASVSGTGGTTVTWTTPFQVAPKVTATVISGAAGLIATASDITTTTCKVYIWDAAGAEQATGTVHVVAAGV